MQTKCVVCGAKFTAKAGNAKYCAQCRKNIENQQRRERVRRWKAKQKQKPAEYKCTICGSTIVGGNGYSKFCADCLEGRRTEQKKAYAEKRKKEKSERTDTCRGCVDYSGSTCEYLLNHGRCRPWPIVNNCCAGKCTTEREFVEWPWDTKRARKLLENGKSVKDVAAELGVTKNALNNWIFRGME
jgi:hypothetical protein